MPIRCVLFDFDGVIADTEERNADYLASALAHFGVRLTEEDRSALVGINDPSLLEALLKRAETPVTLPLAILCPEQCTLKRDTPITSASEAWSGRRQVSLSITLHTS